MMNIIHTMVKNKLKGGHNMTHKMNLFSNYSQFNHLHAPKYFDWVKDGSGDINVFSDDYVRLHHNTKDGKPKVAMLIEPRTIQPKVYEWIEQHADEFDLIFTHDEKILKLPNAKYIAFMQWYKTYPDTPKTKNISMVCSDKTLCEEHKMRQKLADTLGDKVDHYGLYKGGKYCDYYDCRAEYKFEIVVDNSSSPRWLSEKIANPLASKTVPIYVGNILLPKSLDIEVTGMILVDDIEEAVETVDMILKEPDVWYNDRLEEIEHNYKAIQKHQVFEDWFWLTYKDLLESLL